MKSFGRILAIVLSLTFVLSMFMTAGTLSSFALTGQEEFVLTIGSATGMRGDTVDIPLSISKNDGIWGFQISVGFDSDVLSFAGYDVTPGKEALNALVLEITSDSSISVQTAYSQFVNHTLTGQFLTLHFTIADDAPAGDCALDPYFKHNNMIRSDGSEVPSAIDSTPVVNVHVHNWVKTYTWSNDNATCTANAVCSLDSSHVMSETATSTNFVSTQATCEGTGSRVYIATFTNEEFETQSKSVTIPATGHNYGAPTYTWSNDGHQCTATAICQKDSSHVLTETVNTSASQLVAPTCETKGTTRYTANFTNGNFQTQTKDVQDIAALGHSWGTPTYVWSNDNSQCTATAICQNDASHVATETVNVTTSQLFAPTCEGKGTTKYLATFTNSLFEEQKKEIQDIPALGHDWHPQYTWAADGSSCSGFATCSRDTAHTASEDATISSYISKAASSTEKGEHTYVATFTKEAFSTQEKVIADIDMLPFDYEISYQWSNDGKSCVATATCPFPDQNVQENGVITSEVKIAATCEGVGTTTYSATFTNTMFERQQKDVQDIPALGHDWGTPTYTWANDNGQCTATVICQNDANHVVTETVNASSSQLVAATCESVGTTRYTATFTNALFTQQTKDVENIPALGHDWGTPTYTWSNDNGQCTATVVCRNDSSHVITETVNSTSSQLVAATCEIAGTTRYSVSFANDLFTAQTKDVQNIPALGHDWGIPTYQWTADGSRCTATAVCQRDHSHVATETVSASGVMLVDSTTTIMGTTRYTATFTNSLFVNQVLDLQDIPLKPAYILGDVNSDGEIDMKDILMLRKKIASQPIDESKYSREAADVNRDNQIDMKDVLKIRRYIAKYITEF